MKKLDNRGFTLVELLAVVVILVVITLVAIPNISSSIERNNEKRDKSMIKVLKSEGELYISKYKATINNECYVTVNDLVDEGYIDEEDIEGYEKSCLVYDGNKLFFYKDGFNDNKCDIVTRKCHG